MHAQDASASFLHLFYEKLIPKSAVEWCSEKGHSQISWEKDATLPAEGYRILVTPEKMTVRAADNAGFIYAVQSLRQWGTREGDKLIFPCAEITDFPRVKWRSFMLDSGRQYQKVSTIKKYIDMASMLKMNYFHWHLTEGLGWRIEIKRYPLLTRIGAFVGQGPVQHSGESAPKRFYTEYFLRRQRQYTHLPAECTGRSVPDVSIRLYSSRRR